jgi:hypothetical protein
MLKRCVGWASPTFLAVLVLMMLIGCTPYESRTYQVIVRNDSTKTIIPWLTKSGPEYEPGWKSPEDIAIETPGQDEPLAFRPVPPGKTAEIPKITGKFAPGVVAVLRIYVGQMTLDQVLATPRGSMSRIEIVLHKGSNEVLVTDDGPTVKVRGVERK